MQRQGEEHNVQQEGLTRQQLQQQQLQQQQQQQQQQQEDDTGGETERETEGETEEETEEEPEDNPGEEVAENAANIGPSLPGMPGQVAAQSVHGLLPNEPNKTQNTSVLDSSSLYAEEGTGLDGQNSQSASQTSNHDAYSTLQKGSSQNPLL